VINKFYLLCVIFSGSPDLTLKTCLVFGSRYAIVVYIDNVKGERYYREVEVRNSERTDD